MTKVTVGVPVYNGASGLEASLKCLSDQTHDDFQVIISENGSSDRSREIAESFAAVDSRFKVIRHEQTIPAMDNFNCVLQHCDTEYFMWRAHDDLSDANYIERLADELDRSPGSILAVGDFVRRSVGPDGIKGEAHIPYRVHPVDGFDRTFHALAHFQSSWIYGLWRRDAIRTISARIWDVFPTPWSGDLLIIIPAILASAVSHSPETKFIRQKFTGDARTSSDSRAPTGVRLTRLAKRFERVLRSEIRAHNPPLAEKLALDQVASTLSQTWVVGKEAAYRKRMAALME